MTPTSICIRRPDDWHAHLRDGSIMRAVLPYTMRQFARAIVMPNLAKPILDTQSAIAYRDRITAALPASSSFSPLMTCYLTEHTDPNSVTEGYKKDIFTAVKLYPAHATTNSQHGVCDISRTYRVLERMEHIGMPLLVHGESVDATVDVFDRESVFIDQTLAPLLHRFQGLKVVLEHVTTSEAAQFVLEFPGYRLAATVTPHHLMLNRNAIFDRGLRPHAYCLPTLKREQHRVALRQAVTSGATCFFLGTDSAPHLKHLKESECGCAGIFCSPVALESYAQVFAEEGALEHFEAFASINGPRFYGLPLNTERIILRAEPWIAPEHIEVGTDLIHSFRGGETIKWRLQSA